MKMTLRNVFRGYKPGDVCTGAVHMFGLNSTRLSDDSKVEEGVFPVLRKQRDSYGHDQWIFDGYLT